jgi:hypothetical protein
MHGRRGVFDTSPPLLGTVLGIGGSLSAQQPPSHDIVMIIPGLVSVIVIARRMQYTSHLGGHKQKKYVKSQQQRAKSQTIKNLNVRLIATGISTAQ